MHLRGLNKSHICKFPCKQDRATRILWIYCHTIGGTSDPSIWNRRIHHKLLPCWGLCSEQPSRHSVALHIRGRKGPWFPLPKSICRIKSHREGVCTSSVIHWPRNKERGGEEEAHSWRDDPRKIGEIKEAREHFVSIAAREGRKRGVVWHRARIQVKTGLFRPL